MIYRAGEHPGTRYRSQAERAAGVARSKVKAADKRSAKRSFEADLALCKKSTYVQSGGGWWYDGSRFASSAEAFAAYDDGHGDSTAVFGYVEYLAKHLRSIKS